jgi:hypothetical protein
MLSKRVGTSLSNFLWGTLKLLLLLPIEVVIQVIERVRCPSQIMSPIVIEVSKFWRCFWEERILVIIIRQRDMALGILGGPGGEGICCGDSDIVLICSDEIMMHWRQIWWNLSIFKYSYVQANFSTGVHIDHIPTRTPSTNFSYKKLNEAASGRLGLPRNHIGFLDHQLVRLLSSMIIYHCETVWVYQCDSLTMAATACHSCFYVLSLITRLPVLLSLNLSWSHTSMSTVGSRVQGVIDSSFGTITGKREPLYMYIYTTYKLTRAQDALSWACHHCRRICSLYV